MAPRINAVKNPNRKSSRRNSEIENKIVNTDSKENVPLQKATASRSNLSKAKNLKNEISDKKQISLEEQRLKNIEANMKFLQEIDLTSTIQMQTNLSQFGKNKKPVEYIAKRPVAKKQHQEDAPRRKSLRIANASKVVDYTEVENWSSYLDKVQTTTAVSSAPRKPVYFGKLEDFSTDENSTDFFSTFANLNSSEALSGKLSMKMPAIHRTSSEEIISSMKKLKVTNVAKCCSGRIYNTQFLPSPDQLMVATCDKYGKIGLWKIPEKENSDNKSSGFVSQPHEGHVRCLKFSPVTETQLFSCGYDGTLKCTDLIKGHFSTVYKTTDMNKKSSQFDEDDAIFNWFDFSCDDKRTIYISDNRGLIHMVDPRNDKTYEVVGDGNEGVSSSDSWGVPMSTFSNGVKPVKCISTHPKKPYLIASDFSTVSLWDLRYTKYKCIDQLYHGKVAHGAFFSPVTGDKILTTCSDDHLRVFDSSELTSESVKLSTKMRHFNQTGRWLSPLQAIWHPSNEEVFLIGSMDSHRKLEVYTTQSTFPVCNLEGNDTICCRNAIHPYYNIVAGSNASGKVYIWS